MKKLPALIFVLLVVLLTACAAPSTTPNKGTSSPAPPISPGFPESGQGDSSFGRGGVAPQPASAPAPPPSVVVSGQQLDADRMIVRTGNIGLVVEDVNVALQKVTDMATGFQGYVVSSNVFQDRDRLFGSISVRVPAERFDESIRNLRAMADDVTSETTNSQDVTQEYTDLSAQLKNLEATEQQLLRILEKAETVEDTLNVQRELSRTRGEIEQIKGRMLFLERTSATSLINVSLQQSKLVLEFNANRITVKEREAVFLSAEIAGGFAPYSYQWDLGDKTTSTEAALSHTYSNDGKYSVTLTVTDDRGNTITKTRADYITVLSGWDAGNIFRSAWDGLVGFGHAMANVLIWFGVFLPVWIVLGVIAWVIMYWFRRRAKKKPGL